MTVKTTQEDPQERLETFKEHRTNWLSPSIRVWKSWTERAKAPAWSLQLRDEDTLAVLGTTDKYRYDYNKQGIQYLDLLLQKVNKNRNQPREPGGTLENAPVFHQWPGEPQFCTVAEPRLSPPPFTPSLRQLLNVSVQAKIRVHSQLCGASTDIITTGCAVSSATTT
jgi:hypothetical protein